MASLMDVMGEIAMLQQEHADVEAQRATTEEELNNLQGSVVALGKRMRAAQDELAKGSV